MDTPVIVEPNTEEIKSAYEDAYDVLERFEQYKSSAAKWRENISEDASFITPGGMWTQEQVNDLTARGQAPIEIPIISPQIDLQKSQIIGKQPTFKVLPRTDTDVQKAKMFSEICSYVWQANEADMVVDDIVTYQLAYGKGYFQIDWDEDGDDGYGLITINSRHPLNVVVDPNSVRRDEEDSAYKFVFAYYSAKELKIRYPELVDLIDEEKGTSKEMQFTSSNASIQNVELFDNINDPGDDMVRLLEEYTKVSIPFYIVKYHDGESFIEKELYEEEFEDLKASIMEDENASEMISSMEVEKRWKTRIQRCLVVGDKKVYTDVLPTSRYPIVPVSYRHFGNPYTVSLTRYMKGLQQEVNHRRSLMIAHATASTNNKVLMPVGAVPDIEKFQVDWSRPNAVLEFDPVIGSPQLVSPVPMPNSYFQLEEMAKKDAQFIAGSFGLSHGDPSDAPDTRGATMMLDEWSSRRAGVTAKGLYYALNIIGKVIIDFIQFYMTAPRVLRLVNPYDEYEQEMVEIGIGDMFDEGTVENIGDVSVGKYDVVTIVGSMAPSNRYAEAQFYLEALKIGAIDQTEYLKKTDVFDRAGVLQRTGKMQQMQQALEQTQGQAEEIQKENQKLQNELQAMQKQLIDTQRQVDWDKMELDAEDKYNKRLLTLEERINELDLLKKELRMVKSSQKQNTGNPSKEK